MASLQLRNGIWHLRYRDKRGRSCSVSTKLHSSPKNDLLAQKKLLAFNVDLSRGKLPTQAVKIGSLLDDVLNDYTINARKSLVTLQAHIETHLRPWFGELRSDQLTAQDWREYVTHRQLTAKNATINRERSALLRGFSLARQSGTVEHIPYIPRLKDSPARSGFITRNEMESLCRHLPIHLAGMVRFAFLTGWRSGEIKQLQWRHISFEAGEIRLDPGSTKNGEGRVFPMTEELRVLLDGLKSGTAAAVSLFKLPAADQNAVRVIVPKPNMTADTSDAPPRLQPFVFHYLGRPIGWIYSSWDKACKAIGKPGLLFHDLRRSAVREFIRQGMDQRLAMSLTGHRTAAVFQRYRIVAEDDMRHARELMERGQAVGKKAENA